MCNSIAAHAANPPFTTTISADAPAVKTGPDAYTVKAGSRVFITVHLTNVSKRTLSLGHDADSRTGISFGHEYEVRDTSGNSALKRTVGHVGSASHGWPGQNLKPGESMDINGDEVSRQYDLSQPGEYTIQLSRAVSNDPKDGAAKSNRITVTVTP